MSIHPDFGRIVLSRLFLPKGKGFPLALLESEAGLQKLVEYYKLPAHHDDAKARCIESAITIGRNTKAQKIGEALLIEFWRIRKRELLGSCRFGLEERSVIYGYIPVMELGYSHNICPADFLRLCKKYRDNCTLDDVAEASRLIRLDSKTATETPELESEET